MVDAAAQEQKKMSTMCDFDWLWVVFGWNITNAKLKRKTTRMIELFSHTKNWSLNWPQNCNLLISHWLRHFAFASFLHLNDFAPLPIIIREVAYANQDGNGNENVTKQKF